jgi:DNA-directed RNA polymerase subunit alpha
MVPLPQKIKEIQKDKNTEVFEIEPLYPGYGTTIGNSLRRVLLSSLEGAAITKVKIKGVPHEFTTIPGVLEDVIMITLNLKRLRFKMHGEGPEKGELKAKGEKEVKAKDLILSPNVEVVNKDALIATLTDKKANLEMEFVIERGVGYEPVERRQKEKLEIGEIALDAIYSPIKRVAFRVENIRVGERTDFDKLILEIETDGTITPKEALFKASEILKEHFIFISENTKTKEVKGRELEIEEKISQEKIEEVSKMKIKDLNLSQRVINILEENKIKTIGGLLRKSESDLLKIDGLGEQALKEIKKQLKKLGLEIKS